MGAGPQFLARFANTADDAEALAARQQPTPLERLERQAARAGRHEQLAALGRPNAAYAAALTVLLAPEFD